MPDRSPVLVLSSINKIFGRDVRALSDVSLEICAGEILAVRGPSGSGKSTLLNIAGGLLTPDTGTATVDGTDMYALTPSGRAALRFKAIGFVFQEFHLLPYLTVRGNLMSPALGADRSARWRAAAETDRLIAQLGLTHRANQLPPLLSTGEKQRATIARSLVNRPKIVLADEPTANLDDGSAVAVMDALSDFAAKGGAVLLATHDAQAAARAERILNLDSGRIV